MNQRPRSIEQLKLWYVNRNLPPENVTRFFIGKDYKGARAFGIYQDDITRNFIVYKNKSDGSRAIRYEGKDEDFAVNELYKKLKEEIYNQKYNNPKNYDIYGVNNNPISDGLNNSFINNNMYNPKNYSSNMDNSRRQIRLISSSGFIIIFIFLILFIIILVEIKSPKRGYYNYNGDYYYYQEGSWYIYNDYGNWYPYNVSENLSENHSYYYDSNYYSSGFGITDFKNSEYYIEPKTYSSSSSDYDYDYDYDWDSGSSWDSDYTDWDSDW